MSRTDPLPAPAPYGRRGFLTLCGSGLAGLACGIVDPQMQPGDASGRLTARPGEPTASPPSGLTPLGIGGSRDGLLYVPTTYNPESPPPLVVGLHGTGGSAAAWGGWDTLAENRGFIFLAVDSRGSAWSPGSGGDLQFLDEALAYTFARCAVDPERLGLVGYSSGAGYTMSIGVVNGDLFSHLSSFALAYFSPPAEPQGRPSVFLAHGDVDASAPVSNSRILAADLESLGYDVTYVEFEGDHSIPGQVALQQLDWFLGGPS